MAFRDEREALRAKVGHLEERVRSAPLKPSGGGCLGILLALLLPFGAMGGAIAVGIAYPSESWTYATMVTLSVIAMAGGALSGLVYAVALGRGNSRRDERDREALLRVRVETGAPDEEEKLRARATELELYLLERSPRGRSIR